ncbi:protein of unknown function [Pedococcus cremeus]|uniref:DUF4386 domain-containing protein n=1 Tax=Pedococcus cremeus TaxID=587636 RepID=A0A1H9X9J3_9MICO|nr:DUF4386 domain-containing protein [Pedococcus cremeus]SES42729.1 protein of unknown function [Pedococcus cremeus]
MTSYRGNATHRGNAIAVGVLFIACSAASILSAVPLGSTLDGPGYLAKLAVSNDRVVLTALIELVWAATGAAIAIGLYPVLREHNPALALGSVAARVVEGVFVLVGTLSLLALLTVSQQSPAAGAAASSQATGDALLAVRDWALGFVGLLAFGIGALLYYYVLYASRVIPRWLSVWGLAGAALMVVATIHSGFTQDFGFSTVTTVLNIPIGLQELVLAVWLIVRGFTASTARSVAPSAVPATTP